MLLFGSEEDVYMSVPNEGPVTLEWGIHALLASQYLDLPVIPCPEDWDIPHILGPGVSLFASSESIAWCWSPHDEDDFDIEDPDMMASIAGPATKSRLESIELHVTGHSSLNVLDFEFDVEPIESDLLFVLSKESMVYSKQLEELGHTVVSSSWDDRSRDPLEEIRDRLGYIKGAKRVITDSVAAMGASQAYEVPYGWCGNPESLPFLDFFSYFDCYDPSFLNLAGLLEPAEPVDIDQALKKFSSRAPPVGADFCLLTRF